MPPVASGAASDDPQRNFRFFDNRQKYLLFVNTCSEKWEIASRKWDLNWPIFTRARPQCVFDAGVGDGTVLARVMRSMHDRFPTTPFYIVGKEISLEDIRLTLHKMADQLCRASFRRAWAYKPRLCRSALAGGEITERGCQSGVERAGDGRQHRAQLRKADYRSRTIPVRQLEGARWPKAEIRSMSGRSSW